MRVLTDNKPARSGTAEYLAAMEVCRKRRAEGLLADLPGYSDVEGEAALLNGATPQSVEVEFITRPKPGGGIRLEVVPDFETAVSLQVVAHELAERGFDLPHSASALQVTRGERPGYARWSETIPMWVRHQLVAGATVVVADVEDYFGSVPTCRIESALRGARLDPQVIERTLSTVRDINSKPGRGSARRTGLPVSQDDLFWHIADLVLKPVDERLSREPGVIGHIRWIDDFYIAVDSGGVEDALETLAAALEPIGLRLNEDKTRVLGSLAAFEREALSDQHRMVSTLAMLGSRGPLSSIQQDAFEVLAETERAPSAEHARLWKRVYALAARLRSAALVTNAIDDLTECPTAAREIASYLRTLNWPGDTGAQAVRLLGRATTDSESIHLLRALLKADGTLDVSIRSALEDIAPWANSSVHPYALVLLHACLMSGRSASDRIASVRPMLLVATESRSPMARRVALELLWLIPDQRPRVSQIVAEDASHTVRALAKMLGVRRPKFGHATPGTGAQAVSREPFPDAFAGMGSLVAL